MRLPEQATGPACRQVAAQF